MTPVKSFRHLRVYHTSLEEAQKIFVLTQTFPKEEKYSLTDQIRQASRAVGALIAEAWGRRKYPAAFRNKISEAMGEANETQPWLDHALQCKYLDENQHAEFNAAWAKIGGMLYRTLQRADAFCQHVAKE